MSKLMVKTFFDQPKNSDLKTYENIRKMVTGQGDDYASGWLLDYPYFKENQKMNTTDLSKQQALDPDPRVNQQINLAENLEMETQQCFSLLRKQKKLSQIFQKEL